VRRDLAVLRAAGWTDENIGALLDAEPAVGSRWRRGWLRSAAELIGATVVDGVPARLPVVWAWMWMMHFASSCGPTKTPRYRRERAFFLRMGWVALPDRDLARPDNFPAIVARAYTDAAGSADVGAACHAAGLSVREVASLRSLDRLDLRVIADAADLMGVQASRFSARIEGVRRRKAPPITASERVARITALQALVADHSSGQRRGDGGTTPADPDTGRAEATQTARHEQVRNERNRLRRLLRMINAWRMDPHRHDDDLARLLAAEGLDDAAGREMISVWRVRK